MGAPQALCACVDPAASLLAYRPPGTGGPEADGQPRSCSRAAVENQVVHLCYALVCVLFVPPTHCVTLIRDSSDRGLIARVSSLVCRVINRDSLPHAIGYILTAWSPSSFMRLCRPSSVSVGYTPSGDRGSGADGQPWFWSTHGRTESSGLRSGCTAAPNKKREPRWVSLYRCLVFVCCG